MKTFLSAIVALFLSCALVSQDAGDPCPGCKVSSEVLHSDVLRNPSLVLDDLTNGATTNVDSSFIDSMGNIVTVRAQTRSGNVNGECRILEIPYGDLDCLPRFGCLLSLSGKIALVAPSGTWHIDNVRRTRALSWAFQSSIQVPANIRDNQFSVFIPSMDCGSSVAFGVTVDLSDDSIPRQTRTVSFVFSTECRGCGMMPPNSFASKTFMMEKSMLQYTTQLPLGVKETGLDLRFV